MSSRKAQLSNILDLLCHFNTFFLGGTCSTKMNVQHINILKSLQHYLVLI